MKHKLASLKVKQLADFVLLKEEQSHFAPFSTLGGFSKTLSFVQVLVVSFLCVGGASIVSAEERHAPEPRQFYQNEIIRDDGTTLIEEKTIIIEPLPQDIDKPHLVEPPLVESVPLLRDKKKRALSKPLVNNKRSKSKMSSPLRQALIDYRAQRIKKAISGLELAAEKDSFLARYLLAHIYRTGKGGVVDHRRAYEYYRQITTEFSNGGGLYHARKAPYIAHAFVQLARYMEDGVTELDIKSDPLMARVLFEKAAHFGDIEGQYQLGRFLIESGKMRNVKLGQRWLTRAAMKNNPKAQAYLGALYWQGDLVSRKKSLALAWIEFARRNSTGTVKNQVERLYRAVRYDTTEDVHNRAEFYIGRLRTKYNVLWREEPMRNEEKDILDGIILAEPPKDLDQDQLETKSHKNQMPDAMVSGPENFMDGGPSMGFGFQMYDYGGAAGR
ncbi:hypothetical protein NBRC116602_02840 [Hyphomicrobiales bacterium 4NK60-0047b]|jgi:TPR repeat protein